LYFFDEDGLRVIRLSKSQITPLVSILIAIVEIIVTVIVFLISSSGSTVPITQDEAISLSDGWTCFWEDTDEATILSIPTKLEGGYAGRILHLSNHLPDRSFRNPSLMLRTSEQRVAVLLNDNLIYEFQPKDPGRAPGSMYHFINLPAGYEGGRLDIFLSSPLNQFSGIINEIRIGSITSHILFILKQGSVSLVLAVVAIVLGFIMLSFFVSMCYAGSRHVSILYLSLFIILSGTWMCSESRALELFVRNPMLIMCVAFTAQYLAPIPLLAFVIDMFRPKYTNWLKQFAIIFTAHFFVIAILYLLEIVEFYNSVVLFHSVLICCIIVFLVMSVSEIRRGKKGIRLFFLGCIALCMAICADIIRYYFKPLPWVVKPIIYQYGLFVFIITAVAALARHIFVTREEKISHDILMSLAFTDTLTGLKNRRSFDERMEALNKELDDYSSIHLVILDINNLKQVNDTLGHREGDQLIMEGARLISETLGNLGEIFRIGGDEFVVLITNIEPYFIQVELDTLNKKIEAFNEKDTPFKLSIAYGLGSYSKDQDKDLHDVFVRADKSMYICKENQKGLHHAGKQIKS